MFVLNNPIPLTPISGNISCLLYRKISLLFNLSFFQGSIKLEQLDAGGHPFRAWLAYSFSCKNTDHEAFQAF